MQQPFGNSLFGNGQPSYQCSPIFPMASNVLGGERVVYDQRNQRDHVSLPGHPLRLFDDRPPSGSVCVDGSPMIREDGAAPASGSFRFKIPELKGIMVDLQIHIDNRFDAQNNLLEQILQEQSRVARIRTQQAAIKQVPLQVQVPPTLPPRQQASNKELEQWAEPVKRDLVEDAVSKVDDEGAVDSSAMEVDSMGDLGEAALEIAEPLSTAEPVKIVESEKRESGKKKKLSFSKPNGRSPVRVFCVEDEEWEDGQTKWTVFQRRVLKVVEHQRFDYGTGLAIVLNTIMLGFQTDVKARQLSEGSTAGEPVFFSAVETLFCIFFVWEFVTRLIAFQWAYFYNAWNCFDIVVVLGAMIEEFIKYGVGADTAVGKLALIRMLKVAKIMRSIRILRVFRAFRELRMVLLSIFHCLRSLFWVCCLLFVLIYFVTLLILIELTSKDSPYDGTDPYSVTRKKYFSTFLRSLLTMFQAVTGGVYWEHLCTSLEDAMPWVAFMWVFYIGFVYFAITNTVTGIFVDQAMSSASDDLRNVALEESGQREGKLAGLRQVFLHAVDPPGSGRITREGMASLCKDEGAKKVFTYFNMDPRDVYAFFELVAGENDYINFDDVDTFATYCFRLKGFSTSMSVSAVTYMNKIAAKSVADS